MQAQYFAVINLKVSFTHKPFSPSFIFSLPRMLVSYRDATAITTKYQNSRMPPSFLSIFQLLECAAPMRNTTVVSSVRVE